jgi:Family of unknown function (DUF6527)
MNTESIDARKVETGSELQNAGEFCFSRDRDYIYLILPGSKRPDALHIQKGPPGGPRVWGWDGNEEKPTLTPSIHSPGEWHGYLRAGKLESC